MMGQGVGKLAGLVLSADTGGRKGRVGLAWDGTMGRGKGRARQGGALPHLNTILALETSRNQWEYVLPFGEAIQGLSEPTLAQSIHRPTAPGALPAEAIGSAPRAPLSSSV